MNEVLNEDIKAASMLARQIVMDDAGAERKVKCSIPNAALKTGQYVWVKVPCGRLEDMHICGLK